MRTIALLALLASCSLVISGHHREPDAAGHIDCSDLTITATLDTAAAASLAGTAIYFSPLVTSRMDTALTYWTVLPATLGALFYTASAIAGWTNRGACRAATSSSSR